MTSINWKTCHKCDYKFKCDTKTVFSLGKSCIHHNFDKNKDKISKCKDCGIILSLLTKDTACFHIYKAYWIEVISKCVCS